MPVLKYKDANGNWQSFSQITVDSKLSKDSVNPVSNKTIAEALDNDNFQNKMNEHPVKLRELHENILNQQNVIPVALDNEWSAIYYGTEANASYLVQRNENGDIVVSEEPASASAATSKQYVDKIKITYNNFKNNDTIILQTNNIYISSNNINTLTINYPPSGDFISSVIFTTADEGVITITLPDTSKYMGEIPTFANGETWELNICNGVVVGGVIK